MTQNAISVCVVMNSRAFGYKASLSAHQSEISCSSLSRNLRNIPSKLRFDKAFYSVEILVQRNRRFKLRVVASGFPIEDGKAKTGCLDSSLDGRSNAVSEDVDSEEVSSFSYSRSELLASPNGPVSGSEPLDKLKAIRLHLLASEQWNSSQIKLCHRNYSASATNLVHYLALKSFDIERVKEELSSVGPMNWDIVDSCVIPSLDAVIRFLEYSSLNSLSIKENVKTRLEKQRNENFAVDSMRNKASSNVDLLLGPLEDGKRTTHVMVTVGEEAIENENLVADLIKNGTSVIRINCAHGDPSFWSEIIRRVRTSSQMLEKPCRVLMDLAGPKLRTGDLKPGPSVTKISPKKNDSGRVISPAQIWLTHRGSGPPQTHICPDTTLFVDEPDFLNELEIGDTIRFDDARGRKSTLKISRKFHVFSGVGLVGECTRTCYVESGTQLKVKGKNRKFRCGRVVDVPESKPYLRLRVGELLVISRTTSLDNQIEASNCAHRITCSSGLLFDSVKPGEPISFDDGKISGVIEGTSMSEIVVSITHAKPNGTKLGPEKSINIPESDIKFGGLTSKDLMDLEFVASQADMVGASFLRDADDVAALRREVEKRSFEKLGIVLKVETRSGFENLPRMLMEGMKSPNPIGVMVARGDLAVECGWENLADIQDEILRICSASHIPVIWATQVLESFVKSGVPTRAEITDVACGRRANCIMLNKGKHIVEAVSFLDKILSKNSTKMKSVLTSRSL